MIIIFFKESVWEQLNKVNIKEGRKLGFYQIKHEPLCKTNVMQ